MVNFEKEPRQASAHEKEEDGSEEAIRVLLQSQAGSNTNGLKNIGVSFQGLSVTALTKPVIPAKTLPEAVISTFGPDQYRFVKSKMLSKLWDDGSANGFQILSNLDGLVLPGEMLLVLGRPGSGCSTFLRTIANMSNLATAGELTYGNMQSPTFKKLHPRETIYLPEEDRHIASLTVRKTLNFALRTSLPVHTRTVALVNELTYAISRLFGLSHVLDTVVGGTFVPGVSGGERKR
jgi:ATP-binding cassette, subfamily G (WHITE), member 2, SNQ2